MEKQMRADRDKRAAILQAEGSKQSAILTAEGEKQAAVLRARGEAEATVVRAEADATAQAARSRGQAQAIATVFRAIHEGNPDQKLLAYQYLQALPEIARGDANKLWIVPSEISKALQGIGNFFGATVPEDNGKTETESRAEVEVEGKGNLTRLTAAKELTHEAPKPAKSPASPVTWDGAEPGPDLDRA
jgi:uncharacterized membrane protein YqiK